MNAKLKDLHLDELPSDFVAPEGELDLSGCASLRSLPDGLRVARLVLQGCERLTRLPRDLEVVDLDLTGCTSLQGWPGDFPSTMGRLSMSGCVQLRSLPPSLKSVVELDVAGCTQLRAFPLLLHVERCVELADTELASLGGATEEILRWRGVPVGSRVVLHPESITYAEVFTEPNAEVRRVLLERMGVERFLEEADAVVVDQDTDTGGNRQLLKVRMPPDEPLVALVVFCPSTGHQYMLRVPPTMRTCHEAAAWMAYLPPEQYAPVTET